MNSKKQASEIKRARTGVDQAAAQIEKWEKGIMEWKKK